MGKDTKVDESDRREVSTGEEIAVRCIASMSDFPDRRIFARRVVHCKES